MENCFTTPAEMRFILALYDRILQRPGVSYRQLAKWANEDGWRTRRGKEWSAMGIRRIMTFAIPWKGANDDDEYCGKYFLQEMKENPELDGDNSKLMTGVGILCGSLMESRKTLMLMSKK